MQLPFLMRQETEIERFRADTFWTKESETIAWIRSFDPGDIFFDVGANIGVYSLYACSLYPKMVVYAFEPHPGNFKALIVNKHRNGFDNLHPQPFAVGDKNMRIGLGIPSHEIGTTGAQAIDGDGCGMVTIDSHWVTPDHVKIDIDGQELKVVAGMEGKLPDIKSILIEVSAATKGPILDIILAHGFTTENELNQMTPHSRERRSVEGIDAENIVFTR